MTRFRINIKILIFATIVSVSMVKGTKREISKCSCSEDGEISILRESITAMNEQLKIWENHKDFVIGLKNTWNDGFGKVVDKLMKKHPTPSLSNSESADTGQKDDKQQEVEESQSSIQKLESRTVEVEGKLRDEQRLRRYFEQEVKESQSSLESRTAVVEEELRNEQRLRRHLEKEMNETQSSLLSLGAQLQNITISVNAVMSQIQGVASSSTENMNRNIYKDHPQNIYTKVDETRKLKEGTEHVKTEISDGCNASIVSKLSDHVKDLEQKLHLINISISEALVPRTKTLDSEPGRKHTGDMLEDKMAYVLYKTGQFRKEFSDLWTEIRHIRTSGAHSINCTVPVSNDPHLLINSETDPDGTQRLIFGCRPVGQYVLSHSASHVACKGGFWRGQYPRCRSLLDATAIEHFSKILVKEDPCVSGVERYQDPTNCSKFFTCSEGKATFIYCDDGMHIIPKNILCVYPVHSGCKEGKNELINELRDLIPPISIEPNNLDMPYKGLGTGPAGQLIVYPGSNFTLHCLYPESIWEHPHWNVTYSEPEKNVRSLTPKIKKNNVSLTIIEAKEEDSGIYKCTTPFGKSHQIQVLVKDVICPPMASLGKEYLGFRYRMLAGVEYRSLGATVEFPCIDGFEYALCMGNGRWSRDVPDCALKKRCEDPDTSSNENLLFAVSWPENHAVPQISFSCARGLLFGKPSSYCRVNGTWSYSSLPVCI